MENHKQIPIILNNKTVNIDEKCVDIVLWLNNIVGLKTKFCCQGDEVNQFSIQFDNEVTDKQIEGFIMDFPMGKCFNFYKWTRRIVDKSKDGIKSSWVLFEADWKFANHKFKDVKKLYEQKKRFEEPIGYQYKMGNEVFTEENLKETWDWWKSAQYSQFFKNPPSIIGTPAQIEEVKKYIESTTIKYDEALKRLGDYNGD